MWLKVVRCTKRTSPSSVAADGTGFRHLYGVRLLRVKTFGVSTPSQRRAGMTAWVVRGGSRGEREAEALDNGVLSIGFGLLGDLSGVSGRDEFIEILKELHPDFSPHKVSNHGRQVCSFVEGIQPDDLAVMPRKGTGFVAVGVFSGNYLYRPGAGEFAHGRRVTWIKTEVRRDQLGDDLKRSLSADSTVFRPRANGAEERLRSLAESGGFEVSGVVGEGSVLDAEPTDDESGLDVEEYALGQVRDYVERNFHGHGLSNLVAAVLVSHQISACTSWRFEREVPMLAAISSCGEVQQPCTGSGTP